MLARHALLVLFVAALLSACEEQPPATSSYFDDNIKPIVQIGCAQQTAPCHLATPQGTAAGNLDLSTYDSFMRRSDVLPSFGPYSVGLLLLKGGPSIDVSVDTLDPPDPAHPENRFVVVHTDVRHAAGAGVMIDGTGYARLKQWIAAGHTRTGVPDPHSPVGVGDCHHGAGTAAGFDPSVAPADGANFIDFQMNVEPVLLSRCAFSNCHGSPIADFYITCGGDQAEDRWNYFVATQHLASPASTSELLRRPLAKLHGGTFHEGGDVYPDTTDPDYQKILAWAEGTIASHPEFLVDNAPTTPGFRFFANRVQPMLVRKGCMFLNCHSVSMFHDLRLRTGSQGAFSRIATRRNWEMSRLMLSIEAPDPNASRLIAKNLYPPEIFAGGHGIRHRGGSLFEEFGGATMGHSATPADCVGIDADNADINTVPAYCIMSRWHEIERQDAIAAGEVFPDTGPVQAVVWVSRPPDAGGITEFDAFRGGADLMRADATLTATGGVTLGAATSVLGGCAGLSASADVRTPAVSWDGTRIAFAARATAGEPLQLWWMNADGSACTRVPDVPMPSPMDGATGILMHDFDPAWAPDGRLVFASTRGTIDCSDLDSAYCGPTRTPAGMTPNANLYVYDPTSHNVRQLTFLLNQELAPTFMTDGRVIFTAEKRATDFHQLALRRENLDGGDYHPLFAQRGSLGFETGTEVIELANRNFAFVAGQFTNAHGAGTIAIVNRSVGPDQTGRDPADRFYVSSMRLPFGTGAFRSPATLPSTHFIASCDLAASPTGGAFTFQLCDLDPEAGTATALPSVAGRSNVEAAVVYARGQHGVFVSRPDEANAHTTIDPGSHEATINVHDLPMLATLLFANTRTGRPIDADIDGLDVMVDIPPPASARSFADVPVTMDSFGMFYANDRQLGSTSLNSDGSVVFAYRGGLPIKLRPTHGGSPLMFPMDAPFTGVMVQREEMQFYPGESSHQSFQRTLFNGLCAGCHGSISNRELDAAVNIDVLTSASHTESYGQPPVHM